jgi:hypothetical protein
MLFVEADETLGGLLERDALGFRCTVSVVLGEAMLDWVDAFGEQLPRLARPLAGFARVKVWSAPNPISRRLPARVYTNSQLRAVALWTCRKS